MTFRGAIAAGLLLLGALCAPALADMLLLGAGTSTPAWVTDQTQPLAWTCRGTKYYVDPLNGNDSNAGTLAAPLKTLSTGLSTLNPNIPTSGNCIGVMNTATLFDTATLSYSGTANTANGYVVLYSADSSGNYCRGCTSIRGNDSSNRPVNMTGSYVVIDGFDLSHRAAQAWVANGIGCLQFGSPNQDNAHHIWAQNNTVHDCGAGGIAGNAVDYFFLIANTVYNTAISSPFHTSALSIYQPRAQASFTTPNVNDTKMTYRIVFARNGIYNAYESNVSTTGTNTDGNAIIVDDGIGEQNAGAGAFQNNAGLYTGRTLVAANISTYSGGRCVHVFTTLYGDALNNSCLGSLFDMQDGSSTRGCISIVNSDYWNIYNNACQDYGANTTVRVAGSGTTLQVQNAQAYFANLAGIFTWCATVVTTCEMPVTVNGTSKSVSGVAFDTTTNNSTTPGAVSGTLTFTTAVSAGDGGLGNAILPTGNYAINNFKNALLDNDASGTSVLTCANQSGCVFDTVSWVGSVTTITVTSCTGINTAGLKIGAAAGVAAGTVSVSCIGTTLTIAPATTGTQTNIDIAIGGVSVPTTSAHNVWQRNLGYGLNGAGSATTSDGSVPSIAPTVTTGACGNILGSDPKYTSTTMLPAVTFALKSIALNAAGTGYTVGDVVTLVGGSGTAATMRVLTLGASNAIATADIMTVGAYATAGTTSFTSTGGTGSGATWNTAAFVQLFQIPSSPSLVPQAGSPLLAAGCTSLFAKHNYLNAPVTTPNIGAY